MPVKPSVKPAEAKLDPVGVMKAVMEETPELASPLLERGIIQQADDGSVNISGTTETIHAIGDYVTNFTPAANAYVNALVNRIAFVTISSKMYTNPWAVFKKGRLEFGETVEEIFVNLAKPYQFSPSTAEREVFKRHIPDVRAAFHTMNFQKYYPVTISDDQLRQAFLSWQGVTDLIARIVESVFAAAQTDEYLVLKYMLARSILNGDIAPVVVPAMSKENASDIATVFNETSMNLEYQSNGYNIAGVTTHTPQDEQYLITTTKFRSVMNMNVLAAAFNMDKAELMGHVINVDSFVNMDWARLELLFTDENGKKDPSYKPWTEEEKTTLAGIPAVMTSIDFWQVWDNFEKMTENYNGRGLYWNYNYHVWKTFSISPFAQAAVYTATAGSVTGVTVSPTAATLPPGADIELAATVSRTGVVSKSVEWSLTGNQSTGTYVTDDGKVHIAKDEKAVSVVVNATSIANPKMSGQCTVTVNKG